MPKAKSIIHQIWLREAMGAILKKKKSQKEEKVKRGGGSARKSANNSKCVICLGDGDVSIFRFCQNQDLKWP